MKRINTLLAGLVTISILAVSCNKKVIDIDNRDLTDDQVVIISPTSNYSTTHNLTTFEWTPVDGDQMYNFKLVRGSFDNIEGVIKDLNFGSEFFEYDVSLHPGEYELRIKAFHSIGDGSETPSASRKFTIQETTDLTNQTVLIYEPYSYVLDVNVNLTKLRFNQVYSAESYHTVLINSDTQQVIEDALVGPEGLPSIELPNGNYTWKVRAENSTSASQYSQLNFTLSN